MLFGMNLRYLVSLCHESAYDAQRLRRSKHEKVGSRSSPQKATEAISVLIESSGSTRSCPRRKIMQDSDREAEEPTPDSTASRPGSPPLQWTKVDRLRVRFAHAGSGPALVLVHGLLGYSFSWRQVIPTLANQFEVFAPDLPGSGFSDCDPILDCHLASAAKRLLGFLDAVSVTSCDLVGSSYGGATAVMLAALAPSRVSSLVLVSPANAWSRIGRVRLALLRNPALAAVFPALARRMRPLHDYFFRRMWGDPSRITPEMYLGYSAVLRRAGVLEHAVKIIQTWKPDMQELQSILPQLSQVQTLLLWGSKDRTVDPASAKPLSNYFQSPQIAVIEGGGHLPYEECPEEFSRIVTAFLNSVPPAEPTGK
jgi:pimeloyl-ACP methyl ester carboxylesterase